MDIRNHLFGSEPSGYVGISYDIEAAAAFAVPPNAAGGGYVYTLLGVDNLNPIDAQQWWREHYGEELYGPYANEAELLVPYAIPTEYIYSAFPVIQDWPLQLGNEIINPNFHQ